MGLYRVIWGYIRAILGLYGFRWGFVGFRV